MLLDSENKMGIYDFSVAARSRNEELTSIGLEGQQDLPTGFGERFSQANKLTYDRHTNVGRSRLFEDFAKERDKILVDNGLIDEEILTTSRLIWRAESGRYPFLKEDNFLGVPRQKLNELGIADWDEYLRDNEKYDDILSDLIAAHPELNIMSDEQILSEIVMDQFELLHRDQDLGERSTFMGKVGYLTGAMVGWLRDPINSVSSLAGLSPVGRLSMGQNFLRVGAAEAAITGVLELSNKPSEFEFRKQFGEPELTVAEAEKESIFTVLGSFALGGGIGSVIGRAFLKPKSNLHIPPSETDNNVVTEVTQNLVDEVRSRQARGEGFDIEVEQATDLLDEALRVARNAPKDTSYERHMTNYASARKAVAEGLDIKGTDDLAQTTRGADKDVNAPIGSETATPQSDPQIQDRAITDMRTTLARNDVLVRERRDAGGVGNVSSRELIAQLDSEEAAVRATIDCLG